MGSEAAGELEVILTDRVCEDGSILLNSGVRSSTDPISENTKMTPTSDAKTEKPMLGFLTKRLCSVRVLSI